MTYSVSARRNTSVMVSPFSSARCCAGSHSSSGARNVRCGVAMLGVHSRCAEWLAVNDADGSFTFTRTQRNRCTVRSVEVCECFVSRLSIAERCDECVVGGACVVAGFLDVHGVPFGWCMYRLSTPVHTVKHLSNKFLGDAA